MAHQFHKHYSLDEARALLPSIRDWLERIAGARRRVENSEARLAPLLAAGADCGGAAVGQWIRAFIEIKLCLREFAARSTQSSRTSR